MSLDDDPTDFEGILPVIPPGSLAPVRKDPRSNAANGAAAAGVRAFSAQAIAFYFRVPVKAFFRTRVDYLAYAKAINPRVKAGQFSFRTTSMGLLAHAINTHGWRFLPDQVLPPLIANVAVGAVLYTSYLHVLGQLHEPSAHSMKRVFPPPPPSATFTAGFAAGGIQSLIAAPLDALHVRFHTREGHYDNKTMWQYAKGKLKDIGVRGIFAGYGLSFLKDTFGSGIFFATFEYVKAQGYYNFVKTYYGSLEPWTVTHLAHKRGTANTEKRETPVIRPHYALEPAFLMIAGVAATITQQTVLYPLTLIQTVHYERLEGLDKRAKELQQSRGRGMMLRAYYHAYQETWRQCKEQALEVGGMRKWLYRGFWRSTIGQVPSTSAALVIFELVRRKYGAASDEVKINQDGYDILLA